MAALATAADIALALQKGLPKSEAESETVVLVHHGDLVRSFIAHFERFKPNPKKSHPLSFSIWFMHGWDMSKTGKTKYFPEILRK